MSATPSPSENPIRVERAGAITVVRFTCSALLGAEEVEGVGGGLFRLAGASQQPRMVVNLYGVTQMSSAMLAKLMALSKWVWGEAGGRLVLCNIDPTIREVLEITRLEEWFSISRDEPEALAQIAAAPGAGPAATTPPALLPLAQHGELTAEENVAPAGLIPDFTGVLLPCPVCGQPTDSLKEYHYIRWCVYWVLGSFKQEVVYRACPKCMRRFLWTRCLVNAIPANVAWLVGFLPRALYLIRDSYRKGHSPAVERWFSISRDEPEARPQRVAAPRPAAGGAVHPYPAMIPPALIPARFSTWSWWAFCKAFLIVLAIGAGAIFVGAKITSATNNPLPLVFGIIAGLFSLCLAPYYGKKAVRKAAYNSAIAEYTEAIRLNPRDARAYFNRGQVYRILAGEYAWPQMTRRRCSQAIADYDEAIRLDPTNPDAYVGRVNAFGAMGQFDRAIADYTAAIQVDPNNALAYCARATAYNGLSKHDCSIPDATEAIRLAPDLGLSYDARGYGFWHRGNATRAKADFVQAITDFTEAIRLNARALDCYLGRAQVYRALGEDGKAAADEARVREIQRR